MLELTLYMTVLLGLALAGTVKPPPIAYPPQGPVNGFITEHVNGKITSQFLGIPFAQPPVGELRFTKPQLYPVWEEPYDATEFKDSCAQNYEVMRTAFTEDGCRSVVTSQTYSEDCLHINIFFPSDFAERDPEEKLAVMFWIYGGGFVIGSAASPLYNGEILARESGNIVVTMNYRLDVFANLYMGSDTEYTGNLGLYDQRLALQWVQTNIRAFGGDPESVTIFGESAGSYSVHAQMMSPGSAGLFHKAIGNSGNLNNRRTPVSVEYAQMVRDALLRETTCNTGEMEADVNCLREFSSDELINISSNLPVSGERFTIVTDGVFIPSDYIGRIKTAQYNKVPSMWGTNPLDSSNFLTSFAPDGLDRGMTEDESEAVLTFTSQKFENVEAVYDEMVAFYFPNGFADVWQNIDASCRLMTDLWFEAPKGLTLDGLAAANDDTYEYYLKTRPSILPSYAYDIGAHHADDVLFTFGTMIEGGIFYENATSLDKAISRSVMHAWSTFAKTGAPEYLGIDGTINQWKAFDIGNRNYLEIDESPEIRQSLWTENKRFINEVLERVGGRKK